MTSPVELASFVVTTLQAKRLFSHVVIMNEKVFSDDQFVLKIRAQMVNGWYLQIYLYHNHSHYDYAYQVFSDVPMMRWDNKEDCPGLDNYPHHYHPRDGIPVSSTLVGDPMSDLPVVLSNLESLVLPALDKGPGRKIRTKNEPSQLRS